MDFPYSRSTAALLLRLMRFHDQMIQNQNTIFLALPTSATCRHWSQNAVAKCAAESAVAIALVAMPLQLPLRSAWISLESIIVVLLLPRYRNYIADRTVS